MNYERCAACPFFVGMNRKNKSKTITITCENMDIMGFDMKNMLSFQNKNERSDYYNLFCADRYESCVYYKAIYQNMEQRYEKKRRKAKTITKAKGVLGD